MEAEPPDRDDSGEVENAPRELKVWQINVLENTIRNNNHNTTCYVDEADTSTEEQSVSGFKIIKVPPSAEASGSAMDSSQDYEEQVPRHVQKHFETMEEGDGVEFMRTLHEAYEAATEQQEQDRREVDSLKEVILILTNHNTEDMKNVLEVIRHKSKQRTIKGNRTTFGQDIYSQNAGGGSMAGALANFFQQQLQALLSQHELRVQELQSNLTDWMKRCEELQSQVGSENNGSGSSNKSQAGSENTGSGSRNKVFKRCLAFREEKIQSQEEMRNALVEKLHNQLGAKNAKLEKLNNVVHQLERKIAALTRSNSLESRMSSGYEQTRLQSKQLQEQVAALKQEKQQLQSEMSRCREFKLAKDSQLKEMAEELRRERERMQKLSKQLAKYRKKERYSQKGDVSSSSSSSLGGSSKADLQSHIKQLNEKLFRVEEQVKSMYKKDHPDEGKNIERTFLQTLCPNGSQTSIETTPESGKSSSELTPPSHLEDIMKHFETGKPIDRHSKLQRKLETLQSKLEQSKQDLKMSEMNRLSAEQTISKLNEEINKLKVSPKSQRRDAAAEECAKVKQLVHSLEELEAENRDLRHVIAVEKEEQIMKLEKELRRLKSTPKNMQITPLGAEVIDGEENPEVQELEEIIAEKDRLILELRFEHDQAKRRVTEVETRFDILFGEWVEENSHSQNIARSNKPLFGSPRRPSSAKAEFDNYITETKAAKHENQLQLLVYTMKRVIDKLRKENARLKQAGLAETRYQNVLKRNRDLKNKVDLLTLKISNYGNASPHMQVPKLEKQIKELTADLETLTDVNTELIHILRQAEEVYPNLKDQICSKSGAPFKGVMNFPLDYFADQSKYNSVLSSQTQEIARLQDELDKMSQLNNDLMYQLAKSEDELDLLHGKIYIRKLTGGDGVRKQLKAARDPKELKSHATTVINNGCFEVMPGDYSSSTPKEIQTYDLKLVDEIEELRLKHHNLTEICKHYEQLLYKYTEQLQISFKPLRE